MSSQLALDPAPCAAPQSTSKQQRALPGLNAAYNDVYDAKDAGPARPAAPVDTPWDKPWLRKDGRVWVRQGRDYCVLDRHDVRAQRYKRACLTGMFGPAGERMRLFAWWDSTISSMIDVVEAAAQAFAGDGDGGDA